jgi:hypothetical protein
MDVDLLPFDAKCQVFLSETLCNLNASFVGHISAHVFFLQLDTIFIDVELSVLSTNVCWRMLFLGVKL